MHRTARLGALIAAALLSAAASVSAQFIPVEQLRSVSTLASSLRCGNNFIHEERSTTGLDPFAARLVTIDGCEGSRGVSGAAQRSSMNAGEMSGEGAAYSEGRGPALSIVHSFSNSTFDSTFRIEERVRVVMRGTLAAQSSALFLSATARVSLGLVHGTPEFHREIEAEPGGPRRAEAFEAVLILEPGLYRLAAAADTLMDNKVPPDQRGGALFRFSLEITRQ